MPRSTKVSVRFAPHSRQATAVIRLPHLTGRTPTYWRDGTRGPQLQTTRQRPPSCDPTPRKRLRRKALNQEYCREWDRSVGYSGGHFDLLPFSPPTHLGCNTTRTSEASFPLLLLRSAGFCL